MLPESSISTTRLGTSVREIRDKLEGLSQRKRWLASFPYLAWTGVLTRRRSAPPQCPAGPRGRYAGGARRGHHSSNYRKSPKQFEQARELRPSRRAHSYYSTLDRHPPRRHVHWGRTTSWGGWRQESSLTAIATEVSRGLGLAISPASGRGQRTRSQSQSPPEFAGI